MDVAWHIPDEQSDEELAGMPRPLLGTWHYLRNALRREWRTWVGLALAGLAIGLAAVLLLPANSKGTVTLLMAHPANVDPTSAMSTDVSLLDTREVAQTTVRQLRLDLAPEAFQTTVAATPVTDEVLTITVSAPDDAAAVRRAEALTKAYLGFRAEQLRSMSSGLIGGYQNRVNAMQTEVRKLDEQYKQADEQGAAGQTRATDILTRITQLNSQISDMQQAAEEAALTTDASIASTHVLDPAHPVGRSMRRSATLAAASGLLGGSALGIGIVLFRALTADRVRRRQDVALALGAPVRFSVSSLPSLGRPGRAGLRSRLRPSWRNRDLAALVQGMTHAVTAGCAPGAPESGKDRLPGAGRRAGPGRAVAVAAVGNAPVAAAVIAGALSALEQQGLSVFLVDLSRSGALTGDLNSPRRAGRATAPENASAKGRWGRGHRAGLRASVYRPTGVPALARGPRAGTDGIRAWTAGDDEWRTRWEAADVLLALAEVDPGIDTESLSTWVGEVVPIVTAGGSSPELLETTAELIRSAGLAMPFAMMVGADGTDESLGAAKAPAAGRAAAVVGQT